MTTITLSDEDMDADWKVHPGYDTTITIHTQKIEYAMGKSITFIPRPRSPTSTDNPLTTSIDLNIVEEVFTITGMITSDSSASNYYAGGKSSSAIEARNDLIALAKKNKVKKLTWGSESYNVAITKMTISEVATDESTPSFYNVIIALRIANNQ